MSPSNLLVREVYRRAKKREEEGMGETPPAAKETPQVLVEDCANWRQVGMFRGAHCFNCGYRNGWPERGQPSAECENFKLRVFQVRACDCVPGHICDVHRDR